MEDIRENLADAGCDTELTEHFLSLVGQGQEKEALALLSRHRKCLLEHCHVAEKKNRLFGLSDPSNGKESKTARRNLIWKKR